MKNRRTLVWEQCRSGPFTGHGDSCPFKPSPTHRHSGAWATHYRGHRRRKRVCWGSRGMRDARRCISLGDGCDCANTVGFGGRCLRFSSILDGACVSCCLFLPTGSYHVQPRAVTSPDAPQKPLVRTVTNLQNAVAPLLQHITQSCRECGQGQSRCGCCHPHQPNEKSTEKGCGQHAPVGHASQHRVGASQGMQAAGLENGRNMFQFTSRRMCAPMGSLPLRKGATMRTIRIQNNQWSLEHCSVLCIAQFAALCSKMRPPNAR